MFKKLNNQPLLKGALLSACIIFGIHLSLYLIIQLLIYGLSLLFGLADNPPSLMIQFLPQFWMIGLACLLLFNIIFITTTKMRESVSLPQFFIGQLISVIALFCLYQGWNIDWSNPSEWFHITVDKTMVD